jgi:hypothetical protein
MLMLAGGLTAAVLGILSTSPRPTRTPSTARALGIYATTLPGSPRDEARAALASDELLREERFLEAVAPGRAFSLTRIDQADIDSGHATPPELFEIGAQLFHLTFTRQVGYGARDLPPVARFQSGRRGGPDAFRCDSCHWRGGPAGAGDAADDAYFDGDGDHQSTALARNPISLVGAGLVEILAAEMSAELQRDAAALRRGAAHSDRPARGEILAKGVPFGWLTARPDGSFDGAELRGVDADLVVKPFGWKGNVASIRDAVEDALLVHHGMESEHLVHTAPASRIGPYDPRDPDGDGVAPEIEEGQVTALTTFVAMQEIPAARIPDDANLVTMLATGQNQMAALGCTTCHVGSLPLESTLFRLPSRQGSADLAIDLAKDGAEPRIAPVAGGSGYRAFLYSDLRRHDMGPRLAEPRADRGVAGPFFLTRPLWGVAVSGPYMHDGRAATIEDAILLHGGEAQAARDAYAKLLDSERAPLRVFLASLSRAKRLVVR